MGCKKSALWMVATLAIAGCETTDDETMADGAIGDMPDGGSDPGADSGTTTPDPDGGDGEDAGVEPGPVVIEGCLDRSVAGATEVADNIDTDVTWSGVVHVTSSISVRDGATLRIEPGTRVIVDADQQIEVGWNSNAATLLLEGTSAAPIEFCGAAEEQGYWGGIVVRRNVTSDSVLRYVHVADAGGGVEDAALVLEAPLDIDQVSVVNSGSDGVWADDFNEDSVGLSVTGSVGAPVVFTGVAAVSSFPLGGLLTGNGDDRAVIRFANYDVDTVVHALEIPYFQEASTSVREGAVLTFEAGVEYLFAVDRQLEVGWNSNDAELQVNGTEELPVVFRGATEEAGSWSGILIRRNVRSASRVEHAQIWHGGGQDTYVMSFEAPIILNDVHFEDNELGLYIAEQGLDDASANVTITGTEDVPLTIEPDAVGTLPEGGTYIGNGTDQVVIEEGNFTEEATVPNLGIPYFVQGSVTTRDGSDLTIAAGNHFIMGSDARFELGWNSNTVTFTAVGTMEQPIRFTGVAEEKGDWQGFVVGRNVTSASEMSFVEIGHAGGLNADGNLELFTPFNINNSRIYMGAGAGIVYDEEDTTDYTATNTFEDLDGANVLPN